MRGGGDKADPPASVSPSPAPAPAPAAAVVAVVPAASVTGSLTTERERVIATRRHALRRMLLDGAPFLKFGRSGWPHMRHVWLSDDGEFLRWRKPDAKVKPLDRAQVAAGDECVRVSDIIDILETPDTAVFKKNKPYIKAPDSCISVVTATRTLDIEAPSPRQKEEWATALQALVRRL